YQHAASIAVNTTDAHISALHLLILDADRRYFPPYEAVPIIRQATMTRHPEVAPALQALAGKISDEEMRRLNYAVDGERRNPTEVVKNSVERKVCKTRCTIDDPWPIRTLT